MGRLDTRYSPVRRSPSTVASYRNAAPRLACVKPVASVHPEPGSNSPLYKYPIHFRHDSGTKANSHSSRCSGNCKNVFIFNVSLKETSFVCFSECHPNIRLKSKPPLKNINRPSGLRRSLRLYCHLSLLRRLLYYSSVSQFLKERFPYRSGEVFLKSGCKDKEFYTNKQIFEEIFFKNHEKFPDYWHKSTKREEKANSDSTKGGKMDGRGMRNENGKGWESWGCRSEGEEGGET